MIFASLACTVEVLSTPSEESDWRPRVLFIGQQTSSDWLGSLHQPVRAVESIAAAQACLEVEDYAVVLVDVPEDPDNVFQHAALLRSISIHAPVVLMCSEQTSGRVLQAQTGAVDVVLKPVDPESLGAKLRTFATLQAQKRDLVRVRALYDADRRLTRQHLRTLTATSAKLATCMTREEVVQAFISEAHTAVAAVNSFVYLRNPENDHELLLAAVSGVPPQALGSFQTLSIDQSLPIIAAVNTREPVWISDGSELTERFPDLSPRGSLQGLVALPVLVNGAAVGAVAFSFYEPRVWDIDKREFYLTLVAAFVAALERARLLLTERQAHLDLERQSEALRLLADLGSRLSASLDYESVLHELTELLVPTMADWCTVDVLDSKGKIQRIAAHHLEPSKVAALHDLERRYPADPGAAHGVPRVLRTGETEWFADIPDAMLVGAAKDETHLALLRNFGLRSFVAIPLKARGRILGALSVVFAESGRHYCQEQVHYLQEWASRAALSLDNARLYMDQVEARQAIERQARQALLLGDVGTALTRSKGLADALQRCAEAMVRHLDASVAHIWTLDSRGHTLELQASAGANIVLDDRHSRIPTSTSKLGAIAREGNPYFTNDLKLEGWAQDTTGLRNMVAFAGYPLIVDQSVIGVMALYSEHKQSDTMMVGLAGIADPIAIGIDRARAEQRAKVERDTLEVVNDVGRALAAELDHETLVQSVTDYATRLAGAAFGAFFYNIVGPQGETYALYAISGVPREAFENFPMPRNTLVFAPTFGGEGAVRVDDIRTDPRFGQNHPYGGVPKGHLPVASYLAVPVVSRSGAVIGGLFFGHPEPSVFTERHEVLVVGVAAQAAIALDNARLFKEAQRLIAELDKSNRELDQFAYVASHDLKAPLRGISNLSQWLEEDLGATITQSAKGQLGLLRNRVQRLEGLIDGILNYSRAGRVRTKVEHVAVGKLLAEALEMIAVPDEANIEVQQDMPEVYTERVPLQQVFMNLIGNAVKHAKRTDLCVVIGSRDVGNLIEFTVSDNGPGIEPEFHERIWGIFQTLQPRDVVEGTGIGLSVVKKIVENKGGRVGLSSSPGKGAKFWFTWPKVEQAVGTR